MASREQPSERSETRARMKSVLSDTTGMDPEMVKTLRDEMGRKERIRVLTKPATQAANKGESLWNSITQKLFAMGHKKG